MANPSVAIVRFLKEVRMEMKKVTWLTRPEVLQYTAIVIVISAIVGVYLGALDFLFSWMVANFLL
jgi:preprotein translocase subunit SecE